MCRVVSKNLSAVPFNEVRTSENLPINDNNSFNRAWIHRQEERKNRVTAATREHSLYSTVNSRLARLQGASKWYVNRGEFTLGPAIPPRTLQTPLKHYPRADALGKSDATILPSWHIDITSRHHRARAHTRTTTVTYACTRISISWLPTSMIERPCRPGFGSFFPSPSFSFPLYRLLFFIPPPLLFLPGFVSAFCFRGQKARARVSVSGFLFSENAPCSRG